MPGQTFTSFVSSLTMLFSFTCIALNARSATNDHLQAFSAAVHVHTSASSGKYDLPTLTTTAQENRIDVVFLSDSFSENIQFGVPGLRNIFWLQHRRPSITTLGVEKYLQRIEKENSRQQDVLYIPGLEMVPRFFWTGSLRNKNLVCHNHQRNLIVLGINQPGIIRKIPVVNGFLKGRDTVWIFLTRASASLLVLSILFAIFLTRPLARRSGISTRVILRSIVLALIVPAAIIAIAINTMITYISKFDLYGPDDPQKFEQRVLDAIQNQGWPHFWAHPEATDNHSFSFLGQSFSVDTRPYTEVLKDTYGYTGFAGVNEGANLMVNPGNLWDELLQEYMRGKRQQPPWCFGEMLYHYEGQAGTKSLANVQTMIWASERTSDALLDAIQKGRFYARRNHNGQKLHLDHWELQPAEHKNILIIEGSSDKPDENVTLLLIKNGIVIQRTETTTPFTCTIEDAKDDEPAYYRILVEGRHPLRIVSNPLFRFPEGKRRP